MIMWRGLRVMGFVGFLCFFVPAGGMGLTFVDPKFEAGIILHIFRWPVFFVSCCFFSEGCILCAFIVLSIVAW